MEPEEQINNQYNVKNKSKKPIIIAGIAVAVAIIAIILVYFLIFAKPQFIFNTAINKMFNVKVNTFDSIEFDSNTKISLKTDDKDNQELLDEVNKCAINLGFQADANSKEEIINLGLDYDDKTAIEAQLSYTDGSVYAYLDKIFDKNIEFEVESDQKEEIEKTLDSMNDKGRAKSYEKAMKIVGDELKAQIKEEGTFEKENVNIKIGDKKQKLTKSSVLFTQKEWFNVVTNTLSNLAENDKFLECYEESPKDTINKLNDLLKEKAQVNEKDTIKISIYTKGALNSFKGLEFEVYVSSDAETSTMTLLKQDKNVYSYSVTTTTLDKSNEEINGKVEVNKEKGKIKITANLQEFTGTIDIDYTVKYDDKIDSINTKNSVKADELTENDMQSMLQNLKKRPLIGDVISLMEISNLSSSSSDGGFTINVNGTPTEVTNIELGDGSTYSFRDSDTDADQNTNSNTTTSSNNNTNTTLENSSNTVKNTKYSVTYSVPSDFEYKSSYSTDSSKYYTQKEGNSSINANLWIRYTNENKYIEEIKKETEYYRTSTSYKNANLGSVKSINVGGKQIKYQTFSYEYNSEYSNTKYQNIYAWYELDNEYLFVIKLDSRDKNITENTIKEFANISVKKLGN